MMLLRGGGDVKCQLAVKFVSFIAHSKIQTREVILSLPLQQWLLHNHSPQDHLRKEAPCIFF